MARCDCGRRLIGSARGCPRPPRATAHRARRRTCGRRAHQGPHRRGLSPRVPSRRNGRAVRVHRVRVSRARRGGTGRGRRAAVERGTGALRRRGRVEVCLAEARYVERRAPFLDLPGRVRQAKAMTDAGDERGCAPVDVGEERMEAGLPRALVEQLRQLLRPRRFARRMQVLRSIEQRVPRRA